MADKYAPVRKYFKLTDTINGIVNDSFRLCEVGFPKRKYKTREKLKPKVQEILAEELKTAAYDLLGAKLTTDFLLVDETKRPALLVVSRRDSLEIVKYEGLGDNISETEKRALEKKFEDKGYSAYIFTAAGVATKPIRSDENTAPNKLLKILGHETAHHYFFGKPLGKNYGESAECHAINETSAEIVGEELGAYCSSKILRNSPTMQSVITGGTKWMERLGETTRHVEKLLSEGKLEQAETYMKKKHTNQAQLVLWKMYGSDKENGMTRTLNALKSECYDLKDFAETVSQTMNYKQVEDALAQKRGDNEYYTFKALGGYGKDYSWKAPKMRTKTYARK